MLVLRGLTQICTEVYLSFEQDPIAYAMLPSKLISKMPSALRSIGEMADRLGFKSHDSVVARRALIDFLYLVTRVRHS